MACQEHRLLLHLVLVCRLSVTAGAKALAVSMRRRHLYLTARSGRRVDLGGLSSVVIKFNLRLRVFLCILVLLWMCIFNLHAVSAICTPVIR